MNPIEHALREEGLDAGLFDLVLIPAARDHEVRLRPVAARAVTAMRRAAAADGIELVPVSGYRSVVRQTEIWTAKFEAARAEGAEPAEALARNLVFSAPPGWSRHHWGLDLDLVAGELADEPRLEPADWQAEGPCAAADRWLRQHALDFGFVRPYDEDRGGFAVEPWHLSHAPGAIACLPRMRRIDWEGLFRRGPFPGAEILARDCDRAFAAYVLGVQPRLRVAVSR
ncbi:MAG: M15 family metallopeptidase [Planctomycetes bacterium]|nr:M15 family metallopeptidase [Planctomycetota bacterium]